VVEAEEAEVAGAEVASVLTEVVEESIPAAAVGMPEAATVADMAADTVAVTTDTVVIMAADITEDTDTGGAVMEDGDLDWDSALG
jgi:hypothetical protein